MTDKRRFLNSISQFKNKIKTCFKDTYFINGFGQILRSRII